MFLQSMNTKESTKQKDFFFFFFVFVGGWCWSLKPVTMSGVVVLVELGSIPVLAVGAGDDGLCVAVGGR
jgi:hypothetical protein